MTPIETTSAKASPPGLGGDDVAARRAVMAMVAKATAFELRAVRDLAPEGVVDLRPPETGLVMLRGRIGGSGAPFNLGEATVARAAVRLPSGATGFGHVLGRDRLKARNAALVDALWVEGERRDHLDRTILSPLAARLARDAARHTAEVAATRVDFFTLVRGDD
jgi:alpha-D-ribose 1-methylphosphonate 5-triphosphate synthase subunit PhnG